MTPPIRTLFDGALEWRADGMFWRDGTPERRIRPMRLRDLAGNWNRRLGMVELPNTWRDAVHHQEAAQAIDVLIAQHGGHGHVYAGERSRVRGTLIPVEEWERVMARPIGIWWDDADETDILATAERLGWVAS